LTPTGLLMEGDFTHHGSISDSLFSEYSTRNFQWIRRAPCNRNNAEDGPLCFSFPRRQDFLEWPLGIPETFLFGMDKRDLNRR
jgi:hypothetical protein